MDNVNNFVEMLKQTMSFFSKTDILWVLPMSNFPKSNPQPGFQQKENQAVDIVDKLESQEIFAHFYDISGAHSY